MRRADSVTTFVCQLYCNLGASNSWITKSLSRPVMGLLCRLLYLYFCSHQCDNCTSVHLILKSMSHLKISSVRRVTCRKSHTGHPQILGATVQNFVATTTLHLGFVHPWIVRLLSCNSRAGPVAWRNATDREGKRCNSMGNGIHAAPVAV